MQAGVAVLKSYMTTGVRITVTEIQALMSQVSRNILPSLPALQHWHAMGLAGPGPLARLP